MYHDRPKTASRITQVIKRITQTMEMQAILCKQLLITEDTNSTQLTVKPRVVPNESRRFYISASTGFRPLLDFSRVWRR